MEKNLTFEQLMANAGADKDTPMMTPEETDMILASDKEINLKYTLSLLQMMADPRFYHILKCMANDGISAKDGLHIVRCAILDFILDHNK